VICAGAILVRAEDHHFLVVITLSIQPRTGENVLH
jgi:hypothetical protein